MIATGTINTQFTPVVVTIDGETYFCDDDLDNEETGLFSFVPDDQYCYFINLEGLIIIEKDKAELIIDSLEFYHSQHIDEIKAIADEDDDDDTNERIEEYSIYSELKVNIEKQIKNLITS